MSNPHPQSVTVSSYITDFVTPRFSPLSLGRLLKKPGGANAL